MKKYSKKIFFVMISMMVMFSISITAFATTEVNTGLLQQIENVEYTNNEETTQEEIVIEEAMIPMGAIVSSWSSFNVALMALTIISSIIFIIKANKMFAVKIVNVLFSLMIIGLFMETQVLSGYMTFADKFTVLHLIIATANASLVLAATKQTMEYQLAE